MPYLEMERRRSIVRHQEASVRFGVILISALVCTLILPSSQAVGIAPAAAIPERAALLAGQNSLSEILPPDRAQHLGADTSDRPAAPDWSPTQNGIAGHASLASVLAAPGDEYWSDRFYAGADGQVWSLAVDGAGVLYAGGDFGSIGGTSARHIAQWNGVSWSTVFSGTVGGGMSGQFTP